MCLLPLLLRACQDDDDRYCQSEMRSNQPRPVCYPQNNAVHHAPARNNFAGRRIEDQYQQDLARYSPEVAEQRHRERLGRARRFVNVVIEHLLRADMVAEPVQSLRLVAKAERLCGLTDSEIYIAPYCDFHSD